MKKRSLFLITLMLSGIMATSFSSGYKTFGGSFGFYKDLNADVTVLNLSPRFGYFMNSNLMFEIGINHVKIDVKDFNPNIYDGSYSDGEQYTTSLGARLFMKNFYIGFEFVKGFTASMSTGLGNDFTYSTLKFDGSEERGLFKLGLLTPIGKQIYLDSSLHYMFILDKDMRELAASEHDEFTRLAYITLGVSYIWKPKK
tara:strand:+ start:81 stop:677 length:597 start_codon:yes stop_codon:yes gene_type:complete